MKRLVQVIGGLLAVLVLAIIVTLGVSPSLRAFPFLPSAYDAKESCSCLFVEGRNAAMCEQFVAQDVVPIQSRSIDPVGKSVTTRALFLSSTSRWVDVRQGCSEAPLRFRWLAPSRAAEPRACATSTDMEIYPRRCGVDSCHNALDGRLSPTMWREIAPHRVG